MRDIRGAASDRWRAAVKNRSNAALLVAGALLVLLAVAWRFAIAPALKVVPGDIDQLLSYEGAATLFVEPSAAQTGNVQPATRTVELERRLVGLYDKSTSSVLSVEEDTSMKSPAGGPEVSRSKRVFELDRRTGRLVGSGRSGYCIVFPFNTPRGDVPVWSEAAQKTFPAKYVRTMKRDNLSLYEFVMEYHNQPLAAPPRGFAAQYTGGELKVMLSMPDLPVADGEALKPEYLATETEELVVEPTAGNIVETRNVEMAVLMRLRPPGTDLTVTRLLEKVTYSETDKSIGEAVVFARDEVSKLDLQFSYIPAGLLVLGLISIAVGFFAGTKAGGKGPPPGGP